MERTRKLKELTGIEFHQVGPTIFESDGMPYLWDQGFTEDIETLYGPTEITFRKDGVIHLKIKGR